MYDIRLFIEKETKGTLNCRKIFLYGSYKEHVVVKINSMVVRIIWPHMTGILYRDLECDYTGKYKCTLNILYTHPCDRGDNPVYISANKMVGFFSYNLLCRERETERLIINLLLMCNVMALFIISDRGQYDTYTFKSTCKLFWT